MKTPKIIATVGPACLDKLQELQDAGVEIFRLNLSHGDLAWHTQIIEKLRGLSKETKIMFDTKGPEIRTGDIKKSIKLKKGDRLTLINKETAQNVDTRLIYCTYQDLPKSVEPGDTIQFDNGMFSAKVTSTHQSSVVVELNSDGVLGSRRHINLPGARIHLPTLTKNDENALKFGKENKIDMVAVSFARDSKDIRDARALIGEDAEIVAKIENQEGLDKFRGIAREADGVMIARGDLGVEKPIEEVPVLQRKLLRDLRSIEDTYAIVATGLLKSMVVEPRPRRAEVTDIATAVWEGANYLMLSDETAAGKYPVQAVEMLKKTMAFAAENAPSNPIG
jgi:pyruvate kinase